MATFPNFDNTGLNSNSNEVDLEFLHGLNFIFEQRQTTSNNRNNGSTTANNPIVSSANLTSQASHNYYNNMGNMLPTPEGSDSIILSPYGILPGSGHLNIDDTYKDDDFMLEPQGNVFYISNNLLSPQISPTLPPDASMSKRHNKRQRLATPLTKNQKVSSNNSPIQQSRRRSININSNSSDNGNNTNSPNGQYIANTDLPSIMTGSPNKLHSNSMMFSLLELELTSPLINNMVATSIAPSMQEAMPNLNLGGNLVSDISNTHSPTSISDSSSDKLAPITPSSLMKMKKKQPNSPKSGQNESNSSSQQQQQQNQLQLSTKDNNSTFIAPTPPTQIRSNVVVTTGSTSPSATPGRKSIRSNPSAPSPLALGPSKSPHSLKPTISPNLKPKLPGALADEVAEQLANKSNYRSILEGTAQSLGISYSSDVHSSLESRRTTHKAAEQKRRDSLKQSFDELKKVVPYQSVSSKNKNSDGNTNNSKSNGNGKSDGTMKNVSKLFLLKRAHDYIVELEQKSKAKDEFIQKLTDELDELKGIKRRKIEETEKEKNADNEVDKEATSKDEQLSISSNKC